MKNKIVFGVLVLALVGSAFLFVTFAGNHVRQAQAQTVVDGSRADWNASVAAYDSGVAQFNSSKTFTESDRVALVAKADHMLDLVRAHPNMIPDVVGESRKIGDTRDALANTKIGIVQVDARGTTQTGVRVESGWEFRVDRLDGEWTAKANSAEYPLQDGRGYPHYKPGLFGDWRVCRNVAAGALIGEIGNACGQQGEWIRYAGAPALLTLRMNDAIPGDNAGLLKVRYMVRKTVPK